MGFKRVTVFIGPMGGGKSTLAKLAAIFHSYQLVGNAKSGTNLRGFYHRNGQDSINIPESDTLVRLYDTASGRQSQPPSPKCGRPAACPNPPPRPTFAEWKKPAWP